MNRRGFLKGFGASLAALAAARLPVKHTSDQLYVPVLPDPKPKIIRYFASGENRPVNDVPKMTWLISG